jgi:hypothetical protein
MQLAPHHDVRRIVSRAGLAALLLGTALSLTQCVQVTDPISGSTVATFSRASTGDCYSDCAKTFTNALQAENTLWQANKKACNHDDVCIALERARHDGVVDQLKAQFEACRDKCHHQGGGSGH